MPKTKVKPKPKPTGYVVYEGPSRLNGRPIVAIVTFRCRNRKTGPMAQLWILERDQHPVEAASQGAKAICGSCPLQAKVCYVLVGQAPSAIWRSFQAKKYPHIGEDELRELLAGRKIRLGAYGDPAAVPIEILERIAKASQGWTGYPHQLFDLPPADANQLAKLVMCSADTPAQAAEATRRGWRFFLVRAQRSTKTMPGAIQCVNATHGVSCHDCGLCNGNLSSAKSIWIESHGRAKNLFQQITHH